MTRALRPEDNPRTRVVAAYVRRLAQRRKLPLAWLADIAGIGRTTLWRLLDPNETGASDPRLSTLGALAEALEVEIADLLRPVDPA